MRNVVNAAVRSKKFPVILIVNERFRKMTAKENLKPWCGFS